MSRSTARIGVPRKRKLEEKIQKFVASRSSSPAPSSPRNTPAPVVRGPQLEIAAAAPSSPAREPWDTPDHRRTQTMNRTPIGAKSANREARERKYVKSVVSLRLSASLLDDIDELVSDACGAVPPLTRTSIIEDAVTQYLAEIRAQRRRAS